MPTASYYDALCGHLTVILKRFGQDHYRWVDDRGFTVDGLRQGKRYSIAYQLRHARHHARFSNVREA